MADDDETAATTGSSESRAEHDAGVERTRAWAGLLAVLISDLAIFGVAVVGIVLVRNGKADTQSVVAILTSAFTAIGTLTTAYFGIKATANTAKNSMARAAGPA